MDNTVPKTLTAILVSTVKNPRQTTTRQVEIAKVMLVTVNVTLTVMAMWMQQTLLPSSVISAEASIMIPVLAKTLAVVMLTVTVQ
jgi:hypothetical protein